MHLHNKKKNKQNKKRKFQDNGIFFFGVPNKVCKLERELTKTQKGTTKHFINFKTYHDEINPPETNAPPTNADIDVK